MEALRHVIGHMQMMPVAMLTNGDAGKGFPGLGTVGFLPTCMSEIAAGSAMAHPAH